MYLPALVPCCCITNDHKFSSFNNTHLLSLFCGLGIWTQLSSLFQDLLQGCNRYVGILISYYLIVHLSWRFDWEDHFCGRQLASFNFFWVVGMKDLVPTWLLAKGCSQLFATKIYPTWHFASSKPARKRVGLEDRSSHLT